MGVGVDRFGFGGCTKELCYLGKPFVIGFFCKGQILAICLTFTCKSGLKIVVVNARE